MSYDYRKLRVFEEDRCTTNDYISALFDGFIELHGDRLFGDDPSMMAGIGFFHSCPVTVIGQQRGKSVEENMKYNSSMNLPEGYRKALRLMKQAEKFNRPVICFVDTVGAYPGMEAEARGQASAIAYNLQEMMGLTVPIISILIGFGGSGGALALSVANEIIMLEHSILSVVSPQACANILWKDSSRESEAAALLKLTSGDMMEFGIVDKVIAETNEQNVSTVELLDEHLQMILAEYSRMSPNQLAKARYDKFRKIDNYTGIYER